MDQEFAKVKTGGGGLRLKGEKVKNRHVSSIFVYYGALSGEETQEA